MGIKVLLADDQGFVRQAVRKFLASYPEIEIVGEASSFAQIVQMTFDLTPQVIVLDVHMKDESSPADIKPRLNNGGSRIVAMSFWNNRETRGLAESLGAAAFLDKTNLVASLVPTIRRVASACSETSG